ncbi:hypothetical protein MLD38_012385 [Melastoma candidum]|uniref:Uncharacterized protein n=1 Tax=Melastoma candidum TaxID=119954 RepID=A0ACB9R5R2_9MYRT|nr:hypothetical protein MLD38_012385 [Melastoma candidum]
MRIRSSTRQRRGFCHISLACGLKLLNYLQSFVGISIVLYSAWMLNYWNNHRVFPPFPAPSPVGPPPYASVSGFRGQMVAYGRWNFGSGIALGFGDGDALGLDLSSFHLPASWFIYSFMGVGIVLSSISLIGCMVAEATNGCCLCFYAILVSVLLLIEGALVVFIAIDHRWEQDLPFDPTGELDSLRSFIDNNADMCKWVGIAVLLMQGLSLLLTFVLRGLASPRRTEYCEDDYDGRARIREPLLNPPTGPGNTSVKGEGRIGHSNLWSSLVREKYGLNGASCNSNSSLNQSASSSMKAN